MIGRHRSGWRHCAEGHADHPVKRVKRTDYAQSSPGAEDTAEQAGSGNAGPVVSDCQPSRDPGVACGRLQARPVHRTRDV